MRDRTAVIDVLLDVTVTGSRPSATFPGRRDVQVKARRDPDDEPYTPEHGGPPAQPRFTLSGLGTCHDVDGLSRPRPAPPVRPPAVLRGCRPYPIMERALTALARGAGNPGGALWRRAFNGTIGILDRSGRPTGTGALLSASVTAVRPAASGAGLCDIETGSAVWGSKAVRGPGGYFGSNLDALDDCLTGRPFARLVWHDSAVARQHLTGGYDRRRWRPAHPFGVVLDVLSGNDVEVELR